MSDAGSVFIGWFCAGFMLGFALCCIIARDTGTKPPLGTTLAPLVAGLILVVGLITRLL